VSHKHCGGEVKQPHCIPRVRPDVCVCGIPPPLTPPRKGEGDDAARPCPISSLPLAGRDGVGVAQNYALLIEHLHPHLEAQCRRMPASDATRINLALITSLATNTVARARDAWASQE